MLVQRLRFEPSTHLNSKTTSMGAASSGVRRRPSRPVPAARFAPSMPGGRSQSEGGFGTAIPRGVDEGVRRGVNILVALIALIIVLPVLLLIALAIKLTSRGAVLYTQERVGLDRRLPSPDARNHNRTRDLGGRPFT
ncbi:MAG: sugar transferase, partial [Gemmatimonadales bacterium]|nr:sugar transferase [Gemmatimonadales bacterium]